MIIKMVLVAQHGAPREPHLVTLREKLQALRAVIERKNCTFKSRMTGRGGGNQFSSVGQSGPTLCDPMDYSTPGFPVHHQLPELTQTHVHPEGE